jgi:hypothetical protein
MKRCLIVIAFLGLASAATGQVNLAAADLNDAIEMVRSMVQLERKAVVAEELQLTGEESTRFWPVYDAYVAELKRVDDGLLKIITDYAANYDNLPEAMARSLVDDYFDLEMDRLRVRTKYVRRFDDVLPPRKLARFIQIENKLNVLVQLDLARGIPLVQ